MISFRDCTQELKPQEQTRRLIHLARTGDVEALLIEAGVLEQGVLDEVCGREDTWGDLPALFRELLLHAGKAYVYETELAFRAHHLQNVSAALELLSKRDLPASVTARVPEGYLQYALDPRDYAHAAWSYIREEGQKKAANAFVLGVRSIGTSLSAVIAAVVGSNHTITIRPRGDSGHRFVAVNDASMAKLRECISAGSDVLVVDEGPGATGETFFCIGRWLSRIGAEDDQIVLFPSHIGGMGLAPEEHKTWFAARRKYPPPVDDDRMERVAQALDLRDPEDLSGGRWRNIVPGAQGSPANVNHERLKFRAHDRRGDPYLIRYAGLGIWGLEAVRRAERLSEMGIGPEVKGYAHGFLAYRWQDGCPASREIVASPEFSRSVGRYLSSRWNHFGADEIATAASVLPALRENTCEALGPCPKGLAEVARRIERLPEMDAVIADARLQPVEWVRTLAGYVKVDAIDHGNGTRLPGPVHPAWDIAGAAAEYGMDESAVIDLVEVLPVQRGEVRGLLEAVSVYRVAYAACCLGEVDIAAREAPSEEDRVRLEREIVCYRDMLRRELDRFV